MKTVHFDAPMPFVVPSYDTMIGQVCGKEPDTVLVIEQMFYTVRINEYIEPLQPGRHWCYETLGLAIAAMVEYVMRPDLKEPDHWLRATDFGEGVKGHDQHYRVRVRRRRLNLDGSFYITTDGEEE